MEKEEKGKLNGEKVKVKERKKRMCVCETEMVYMGGQKKTRWGRKGKCERKKVNRAERRKL